MLFGGRGDQYKHAGESVLLIGPLIQSREWWLVSLPSCSRPNSVQNRGRLREERTEHTGSEETQVGKEQGPTHKNRNGWRAKGSLDMEGYEGKCVCVCVYTYVLEARCMNSCTGGVPQPGQ